MGFGAPEKAKNCLFHAFGFISWLSNTTVGAFSQKNENKLKPVRMVIEGLKFKILAYGMFTRARDNIFVKDRLVS